MQNTSDKKKLILVVKNEALVFFWVDTYSRNPKNVQLPVLTFSASPPPHV